MLVDTCPDGNDVKNTLYNLNGEVSIGRIFSISMFVVFYQKI